MRIQHNIMAMNAYRNYNTNNNALSKNLEKLSSGYAINRAGDDAAGLAISEKMRAQITGLSTAQDNAQSGINLVQTTEGALTEVHDMLNRMYELANQSANGTYDEIDREQLNKEVDALKEEINRIADSTNFNGIQVLDGSLGLNTDAFDMASIAAQKAGNVRDDVVSDDMAPAGTNKGTDTILHEAGVDATEGSFTIDLSQLELKADGANKAKVKVKISGFEFEVEAADNNSDLTADDIAKALNNKELIVKADGTLVKGDGYTGQNGDLVYTATDNGDGTVTFKTTHYYKGTTKTALTDGKLEDGVADDAATYQNWKVEVSKVTGNNDLTGAENIGTTNITTAKKPDKAVFGNAFLKIDLEKLTDGMTITIAGEDKTIGLKDGNSADIDLSDLDLTVAGDQSEALNRITAAFANNQNVSVGHDSNGNLTIAEKVDPATGESKASEDIQKAMSTLDGFKSLVNFTSAAKNVGTEISAKPASIKDGDVLTIDGKKYTFTTDTTKTDAGYIQMGTAGADAMKNLEAALKGDGYTTELNGDKLTVYAKTSDAEAPVVLGNGLTLQIGDTSDSFNKLSVLVQDMHANSLGISEIDISSQDGAAKATDLIKAAINTVSDVRGTLGATQNRLEHTINSLSVTEENITSSESSIRDTDVAEEMMAYTKNNILIQSAQAMLAQANQVPQGVLQLLG